VATLKISFASINVKGDFIAAKTLSTEAKDFIEFTAQ